MLRALAVLLLLANLAFFAWARGWLGPSLPPPHDGQHEPQRLANQFQPGSIVVLGAPAASAAVTAAVSAARAAAGTCLEAGPLAEDDLPVAEAALAAASMPGGSWQRDALAPPPLWLVVAGRWPDPAVRRARQAELRRVGIDAQVMALPADGVQGLVPGLVISRHAGRDEAEAALAALPVAAAANAASAAAGTTSAAAVRETVRGALRGLRVQQLPVPGRYLLRVAQADGPMQARLQGVPAVATAGGFRPCAARP